MEKQVKVGVAVIISKGKNVLLGERKSSHGSGTWGFPGGHLEFGESLVECSLREVAEENGVTIKNVEFFDLTEDFFVEDNKHYITIFMKADYVSGEPKNLEPHKCNQWKWFEWGPETIPENIFLPIKNLLKKISMKIFKEKVLAIVKKIPKGSVMTYKEVATRAGNSGAARVVGTIMAKNTDKDIPCHRVIRSDGSIGKYNGLQSSSKATLLKKEGYLK